MKHAVFDLEGIGAIIDLRRGLKWPAAELRGAVAERRASFEKVEIGPGSRVVIAHGGSPEFFADLFAIWAAGACAACVGPDLTPGEFANVVAFTEPDAVLVGEGTPQTTLPAGVRIFDELPRPNRVVSPGAWQIGGESADPALMLFTSGTTGKPKAVMHSFGSLAARINHNHRHIDITTLRRALCVLPTHFGHGLIGNCLTPLFAGGDLFLATGGGLAGAARLGAQLAEHDITFMSSVPAFWMIALKASPSPLRQTLRQVSIGSAPVAAELVRTVVDWSGTDDVRNMYGITETANWIAGGSARDRPPEDGLIGPMWGGTAAVRRSDAAITATGEGEIVVRPPSLMTGYFRRLDLMRDVVRDGWYHTGDSGTVDANGCIRLGGRIKSEINRGGIKVSPEEVDLLLERHPAVAEACTFGLKDPVSGETVAVAVRLVPGRKVDSEELRAWCMKRIRRECVPEHWSFLADIPKTNRGKLNRNKVREVCLKATAT